MKRSLIAFVFIACMGFFAACNSSEGGNTAGDAAQEEAAAKTTTASTNDATKQTKPAEEVVDNTPKTTIEFDNMVHDWGNINDKDKVGHTFKFTNTGDEPLIISSAKGSCGCTVPQWPKEPIAPGGTGEMTVEFDPKNKSGKQTKTVTVQANTDPNPTRLTVKATVEKSAAEPAS